MFKNITHLLLAVIIVTLGWDLVLVSGIAHASSATVSTVTTIETAANLSVVDEPSYLDTS